MSDTIVIGNSTPQTAEAVRAPQTSAINAVPTNVPAQPRPVTPQVAGIAAGVIAATPVGMSPDEFRNTSKVTILFGDSGLGKSTELYYAALAIFARTAKPLRLVSVEASSQTVFESLIEAGIVESFIAPKLKEPFPVFRKLSNGLWPGKDLKTWEPMKREYSAYLWEGLTSTSECLLEDLREKARSVGQDVVGKFEEGGEKFSKAAPSHYDLVQSEAIRSLKAFSALPTDYLFVSAHEAAGKENDTLKSSIRGAGMVGSAKVDTVKKWCGSLLHLEGYPVSVELKETDGVAAGAKKLTITKTRRRIWFQPHPDLNNPTVTYPAKVTLPPDKMPKLLEKYPNGYFEPELKEGSGLDGFINCLSDLLESSAKDLTAWKKEIEARHAKGAK